VSNFTLKSSGAFAVSAAGLSRRLAAGAADAGLGAAGFGAAVWAASAAAASIIVALARNMRRISVLSYGM